MSTDQELLNAHCELAKVSGAQPTRLNRFRTTIERGMATAEYAVGILAAVALALVLLKVVTNNGFFTAVLKVVTGIIGKISGMLP